MTDLKGLNIVSDQNDGELRILKFSILKEMKTAAIETLLQCLDDGSTITLYDNRDKRDGAISLKIDNGIYYQSGGGRGFSVDWSALKRKDAVWFIKVTASFNHGDRDVNHGVIKI